MLNRLFRNWAYAAPPMAILLVGLYPFIGAAIAWPRDPAGPKLTKRNH